MVPGNSNCGDKRILNACIGRLQRIYRRQIRGGSGAGHIDNRNQFSLNPAAARSSSRHSFPLAPP